MSSFYEGLTPDQIAEKHAQLEKNYEKEFGNKLNPWDLVTAATQLIDGRRMAFLKESLSDLPTATIKAISDYVAPKPEGFPAQPPRDSNGFVIEDTKPEAKPKKQASTKAKKK